MAPQKKLSKIKPLKNTTVTMNKDLKQWLSAEPRSDIINITHTKFQNKKPKGKCIICRIYPAKFVCIKCGNSVCSSCFFTMVGLCKTCLSKVSIEKWKNKKTDWKKILEVDWID